MRNPIIDRELSLTAGPMYGSKGSVNLQDAVALRYCGGKMKTFTLDGEKIKELDTFDAYGTSAIVAADFAGEGIEVGPAEHSIKVSDLNYLAVLQAPPYHVDNLNEKGTELMPAPTNFSYVKGAMTKYAKNSSSSNSVTTNFHIENTVETIFAIDSDETRNVIGGLGKIENAYGTIKTFAGLIPGSDKYTGAIDKVVNFVDNCKDKIKEIKEGFDKVVSKMSRGDDIATNVNDALYVMYTDQNIWRYPVVNNLPKGWGDGVESYKEKAPEKFLGHQDFLTFTLCNTPTPKVAISDASYQPTHELGNLFSYPTSVANTEGYAHKQKDLTGTLGIDFGSVVKSYLQFDKMTDHEETKSKKVETGYISQGLSLVDQLFGTDLAKVPEDEVGPTYRRTESEDERIECIIPDPVGAPLANTNYPGYKMEYGAYVGESGAITCSYGVTALDSRFDIWSSKSLYSKRPDPSFVLPSKFKQSAGTGAGDVIPKFEVNQNRGVAMSMQGVRFYAKAYNRYTTNDLLGGSSYDISVPLYNASFVKADNVRVDLYLVTSIDEQALQKKTLIGTQHVSMDGWAKDHDNKAWAKFPWNPNVKNGHYFLYAVIDGVDASGKESANGVITEVHERRSKNDPGGNNEGYFEISVTNPPDDANASSLSRVSGAGIEVSAGMFPTLTFNGIEDWREFYNQYITNTDGIIYFTVELKNNLPYLLPEINVYTIRADPNNPESYEMHHASKRIVLFPYETYRFGVVIAGEEADKFRKSGANFTYCMYDLKWLRYLERGDVVLKEYEKQDDEEDDDDDDIQGVSSSSSGGCSAAASVIGLGLVLAAMIRRKVR